MTYLFTLLFIVKMKYIISESQYNLLSESSTLLWVKRRVTYENMKNYISDGEINFPTLCDDFGDEFEYADSVIKWAVDDFLTSNEDVFLDEIYDEVHEIVVDKCKDWFGEYLLNIYRDTCTEEDGYGLYEQNESKKDRMTYMNGFCRSKSTKTYPDYLIDGEVINKIEITKMP